MRSRRLALRQRALCASWAAGFIVLFRASDACAQDKTVRIEYRAPDGCPSENEFLEQVRTRTEHARFAPEGEIARTLRITITSEPDKHGARVEFTDADGRRVEREVEGETCAEVVSGIALITALAIDERIKAEERAPPSAGEREAKPPLQEPPASKPPPPVVAPSGRVETSKPLRLEAGAALLATTAMAPELLWAVAGFVGIGPFDGGWSARLAIADAPSISYDSSAKTFYFGATWGRLEGCPLELRIVDSLALVPCAALDLGVIRAEGVSTTAFTGQSARPLWAAASAIARLELVIGELLLVGVQGEIGYPFVQGRDFDFKEPGAPTTIHTIPPIRFGFGTEVGFRFH